VGGAFHRVPENVGEKKTLDVPGPWGGNGRGERPQPLRKQGFDLETATQIGKIMFLTGGRTCVKRGKQTAIERRKKKNRQKAHNGKRQPHKKAMGAEPATERGPWDKSSGKAETKL